ncbi:3-oxo-5a-steroid 4- dehydrogenase [Scheffersomyces spartinae]|uniref:very-long-chain enoyl-CoA reductase n=1 Tax=Scheffersomyces spartinae TaxID=45513 RepID=A0A9P7V4W1_9ASCO|nr:3-oxo-5a-steroid 4- dehydrogenase [Scheffersomyces spartinae]KAG7191376.1 3-oxo-5a-steroid 4- dehydrogenase [Scheffersomyces spartinae]
MVAITISLRSRGFKGFELDVPSNSQTQSVLEAISKKLSTSVNRIRLTQLDATSNKQVPLDTSKSLVENGVNGDQFTLYIKDLGPQIAWRTVFQVEYLGPLLVHPLFYFGSQYFYSKPVSHNQTQWFAYLFVMFHFIKRELETSFVHKFSNATMPAFNIFKNSGHYWILSGFNLAYFIYGPEVDSDAAYWQRFLFHVKDNSTVVNYVLAGLFVFAELSNFKTHLTLSNLRPEGSKKYVIPTGYGFDLVSVPNYFFESLSWLIYTLLVGNWSAWLFFAVGTAQMWVWGVKKHKRYLKTFGDDYKKLKRKIFVPYVI